MSHRILVTTCRIAFWLKTKITKTHDRGSLVSKMYGQIWQDAAHELEAEVTALDGDFLEITKQNSTVRVVNFITPIDDPVTLKIAGNRSVTYKLLQDSNLTIPEFCVFDLHGLSKAEDFLKDMDCDVVVKPAAGTSGGRGITTGISTATQLRMAAAFASIGHKHLIVEQMVPGDCYRLLYLNGELLDAVVRKQPELVGDGRSRISELIDAENERRLSQGSTTALSTITRDLDLKWTLRSQGFSLRTVLPIDQRIAIKRTNNESTSDQSMSVMALIGPALLEEAATAVRVLGVKLAGVDVVTTNPGKSLRDTGGAIIEINTTPGLHHHYLIRNKSTQPATKILQYMLESPTQ